MIELGNIKNSIIEGDTARAVELTRSAVASGIPAKDILSKWTEAVVPIEHATLSATIFLQAASLGKVR